VSLGDRSNRINHDGPALLWRQVADDLENDIDAGTLPSGSRLPSEIDLAESYAVARVTIRRAIAELVEAGHVVRVHGRGTYIA
jgi:DNA-binding GntR family transcriptional regulator